MSNNVTEDLRKIMMAGIGAISMATEKSKEWVEEMAKKGESATQDAQPVIDDLAQKGAAAFEQSKVFGSEMKTKLQQAFENIKTEAQQLDMDEVVGSLHGMTDEALETIKQKLDEIAQGRKDAPQEEKSAEEEDGQGEA